MSLKDLHLIKLSKLISQQIDHVTCLECCKFYVAPAIAPCGHSLCHNCWRGRRTCPTCATSLDRKALRLNLPLQELTEHVQILGQAFEKLFDIKLDKFILDTPGELESTQDPNKNVKDWLASSQNHFSAPLNSQLSSQELHEVPNRLEITSSNIQIHTHNTKTVTPPKIVYVSPPQDDWDKIEPMPDPEFNTKNKENIVGPMDIEPFYVDDSEYTVQNPRRSSRKRELKNDNLISNDMTTKQSSRDSGGEIDKKSEKLKQNWSNVKKMRKEFSKLNRKNRNKLNVSIEMVKKAQNVKPNIAAPVITQQVYNIDDKTPEPTEKDIEIGKDITNTTQSEVNSLKLDNNKTPEIVASISKDENNKIASDDVINNDDNIPSKQIIVLNSENNEISESVNIDYSKSQDNDINKCDEIIATKMPFIKKSALMPKNYELDYKVINNENNETTSGNTDDIEITIKIGKTITNIVIKRKESDVQVKVNTDREVQTSLGNHGLNNKKAHNDGIIHNVEVNLNDDALKTQHHVNNKSYKCPITQVNDKSTSVKKNTASADTATAQFEITESVEKELSKIMECEETPNYVLSSKNEPSVPKATQLRSTQNKNKNRNEYLDDINDLDIFGSGSIKETNVHILKEPAPSEILVSTIHNKLKTSRTAEKRDRDVTDDDHLPLNKKMKTNQDNDVASRDLEPDSETINYDAVMDQVFANIDADIEDIKKSQQAQDAGMLKLAQKQVNISDEPQPLEVETQNTQTNKNDGNTNIVSNEYVDNKHSENVFSMLDKEDENSEIVKTNKIPQQVEDLLTPVLCRNLNTLQESQDLDKTSKSRRKSLPEHDDSDRSVVEETPQKNISFSKLKRASTKNISGMNQSQADISVNNKIPSKSTETAKSVINLTDTLGESSKDVTVIDTDGKKQILETPLTITKFADQIKHKSTPVARKSLNFDNENFADNDPEQTLCPTSMIAKTTQEKEFLDNAFEKTPTMKMSVFKSLAAKNLRLKSNNRYCLAGSCLAATDIAKIKVLCKERNWTYVDKFTKDITHLIVGIDEENKSQRSVKYMCALAASKWIVSLEWVKKCLLTKEVVNEEQFEALDSTGEPGPRRSRIAKQKLFQGITFFCMSPFSVLDEDTLKDMLIAAGGRVVNELKEVRVTRNSSGPSLLLAEPENTQEDRFIYLTMELGVVPVNFEWVLNCLGSYTLSSVQELLLCPSTLLPPATSTWPEVLLAQEDE